MMSGNRTRWAVAAVWMALCSAVAVQARPIDAALTQVSSDTQVVFVIPNLAGLSDKVALLNRTFELDMAELDDLLGQIKQESGIQQGVRDDGALIIVVEGMGGMFAGVMPRMHLLLPISDYGAFVSQFGGSAEQAVTQLRLPTGAEGFARNMGEYALLGVNPNDLRAYRPGQDANRWFAKAGAMGADVLRGSDIAILIDVEALSPTLMGLTPMVQGMAEMGLMELEPEEAAQARNSLQAMIAGWTAFIRDARGLVIGLDVTQAGMGVTSTAQFKDNSPMAQLLQRGGEDAAAYLQRLPDRPFIAAYGVNMESLGMAAWMEGVLNMMVATDPSMAEAMAVLQPTFADMKGTAGVLYADDQGSLAGVQYLHTRDAAAYRTAMQQYMQKVNGTTVTPGSTQQFEASYTPNIMQIDGVQIDRYTTDGGEEMAQLLGPLEPLMRQDGLVAATGEHVITTTTADQAVLQTALASARGQGAGLGNQPRLMQMRALLTPQPVMEVYIDMRAVAAFLDWQVDDDGPNLAAMSASVDQGGVAFRYYVPASAVRLMKQAAPAMQEAFGPF